MKFYPLNGYIQIEKVPERESAVLIPNDSRFGPSILVVRYIQGLDNFADTILKLSSDLSAASLQLSYDNSFLIVESHMIEKIEFEGNEIFIIPKSGIKGLFQK